MLDVILGTHRGAAVGVAIAAPVIGALTYGAYAFHHFPREPAATTAGRLDVLEAHVDGIASTIDLRFDGLSMQADSQLDTLSAELRAISSRMDATVEGKGDFERSRQSIRTEDSAENRQCDALRIPR
jgi:hypothetical protein